MADEHQVTRATPRRVADPAPPRTVPRFPDDPDAARREIAATRARMSETIDEIEDVLLRKKSEIKDKMDVLAPVREQPLKMLGIIFGGALALGFLTGGGKGDEDKRIQLVYPPAPPELEEEEESEADLAWEEADAWEDRAHRLLRIAKAQEAELEIHRSRRDDLLRGLRDRRSRHEEEDDDYDYEPGVFDRIRETAAERLGALASEMSHRLMRSG